MNGRRTEAVLMGRQAYMLAEGDMVWPRITASETDRGHVPPAAAPDGAASAPAFADFAAAHAATAYRVAYVVVRRADAAEDVVQEALLRAWRGERWRRLEQPAAWLARVAWRLALDRRKALARAAAVLPLVADVPSPGPGAARQLAAREEVARLRVLIAALPPALRHPLQLAGLGEFDTAEVAQILGLSPAAVRRRLMRARQLLRARLAAAQKLRP
ncbi:MAG: RNA polymerase sigma factor [Terriglobales bacterium]